VEKELDGIEGKVKSLQALRTNLQAMLAAESEQWAGLTDQKTLFPSVNGAGANEIQVASTPLSKILRDELADQKHHTLKDLAKAAVKRGYPFGQKAPGRVVHFALLGMKGGNLVQQLGKGVWKLQAS
jgi:hypothetical protein